MALADQARALLAGAAQKIGFGPVAATAATAAETTTTVSKSNPGARRRRKPWEPTSWYGKALCWILAPVLDTHDNYPSGPRCMAWFIAISAGAGIHEIGAALASMLLGTMWGYTAWKDNQAKQTLALAATQAVNANYSRADTKSETKNETTTRTITIQRNETDGTTMQSMPPVPGAKRFEGDA